MAWYKVRNNTRGVITLPTFDGFYKLRSREIATLDLVGPNTIRLRALQQGAQLTLTPVAGPSGKVSKPLPRLHLGSVNRYPPLPGGGGGVTPPFVPKLSLGSPRNMINLLSLGIG